MEINLSLKHFNMVMFNQTGEIESKLTVNIFKSKALSYI